MGQCNKKKTQGLFDNGTFDTNKKALPGDEIIPVNVPSKLK